MSCCWSTVINVSLLPRASIPRTRSQNPDLFMPFIFNIPTFPPRKTWIVWEALKCCYSAWVSFHRDDISAVECRKSLDIMEREQPFVLPVLLFIGAAGSRLSPFPLSVWLLPLSRSLASSAFLIDCLSCFVWHRHAYAQFVLWWLQAGTVC